MSDRFSRKQPLIGKEGADRLSASRAAVFGIEGKLVKQAVRMPKNDLRKMKELLNDTSAA